MITNLKRLREQRGLSLRAAGALVRATGQAQMQWERGDKRPIAAFHDPLEREWGAPLSVLLAPAESEEAAASAAS